jgi:CheY-like chemotaxis protein
MNTEYKRALFSSDLKNLIDEHNCMFENDGFQIFTASTAEEAFNIHKDVRMDLIVTDIDFPQMGGDKLCSMIKNDISLKRVYVSLVCSGKKPELQRCIDSGADSFIKKPAKLNMVTDKICRILDTEIRKDRRMLIKVTMQGTIQKEPFFCISKDISASGVLFEADKTLAKGDRLQLSFIIPDEERVKLWGEVVRVSDGSEMLYRYGLSFIDVEPDLQETIKNFASEKGALLQL